VVKKPTSKLALGAIIGLGIGYVAGIFTAHKSGKDNRKYVAKKTKQTITNTEHVLKSLHTDLENLIRQGKVKTNKLSNKTKVELKKALAKAQRSKQKIRELLSAIHEGEADDKDLKKAVIESKKAVSHLKVYLKKDSKK